MQLSTAEKCIKRVRLGESNNVTTVERRIANFHTDVHADLVYFWSAFIKVIKRPKMPPQTPLGRNLVAWRFACPTSWWVSCFFVRMLTRPIIRGVGFATKQAGFTFWAHFVSVVVELFSWPRKVFSNPPDSDTLTITALEAIASSSGKTEDKSSYWRLLNYAEFWTICHFECRVQKLFSILGKTKHLKNNSHV